MKKIESFPLTSRRSSNSKLNYAQLFDGGIYVLERGVDFKADGKAANTVMTIRKNAKAAGVTVQCAVTEDDNIVVQKVG